MNTFERKMVRHFEKKAMDIASLMYSITEKRLAAEPQKPGVKEKALCAAAQSLHAAIQAFLAALKIE